MGRRGMVIIYTLIILLSVAVLFLFSKEMTAISWITLGFVVFAYVSVMLFQLNLWKQSTDKDSLSYRIPGMTALTIYLVIQIPLCLIMGIEASSISVKTGCLVNCIVAVVCWILIISGVTGNDHAERVNSRQKNHHIEL